MPNSVHVTTHAADTSHGGSDRHAFLVSRRGALLGAASLLLPLRSAKLFAAAQTTGRDTPPPAIRLDSNENPYGPSPAARQAIMASIAESSRYADASIDTLKSAIATHEDLTQAHVILGSGSSELLHMTAMLAADGGPSGELIAARPTFEDLSEFAHILGVKTCWVPVDATHRHNLAAMQAAINDNTRLIYVCNPNNPTGTVVSRAALESFIRAVPKHVLVLVDEAYLDFITDPSAGSVASWVDRFDNLIVIRTFSKIHGLAGLRVGYGFASPPLAARVRAKQLAFPNVAGLKGALASLEDRAFLRDTRAALLADRARLERFIDQRGLARAESQGNFVFFDVKQPIQEFRNAMAARGIKTGRPFDGYPQWARITVGIRPEVDRLLAILPEVLTKA